MNSDRSFNMCVCACVGVSVCVCVCMYVRVYLRACVYVCVLLCVHASIYVRIYILEILFFNLHHRHRLFVQKIFKKISRRQALATLTSQALKQGLNFRVCTFPLLTTSATIMGVKAGARLSPLAETVPRRRAL